MSAAAATQASEAASSASPAAMNRRGPWRSASTPAIGAVTAVAPVHTSIRTPASKGSKPMTSCVYWVIRKIAPNTPKYMKNDTPLVTANVRLGEQVERQHRRGRCAAPRR